MDTPWYLYMIENRLGQLYTGISTDPVRRFRTHQKGLKSAAKALKGKGPLTLRYVACLATRRDAAQAEVWVKKLSREQKLELIEQSLTLPWPGQNCLQATMAAIQAINTGSHG